MGPLDPVGEQTSGRTSSCTHLCVCVRCCTYAPHYPEESYKHSGRNSRLPPERPGTMMWNILPSGKTVYTQGTQKSTLFQYFCNPWWITHTIPLHTRAMVDSSRVGASGC